MNYWICRGKAYNEFRTILKPGKIARWHTARLPKRLARGDILFMWESSPYRRLVGLSRVHNADCGTDGVDQLFEQKYLTRMFPNPIRMEELRRVPIVDQASFLKSGPAHLLLSVTEEQADILLAMLEARNPNDFPRALKRPSGHEVLFAAEMSVVAAREGGRKLAIHYYRERRPNLARSKKAQALALTGRLECEVCGFDFKRRYGVIGEGFCEVHHKTPLHTLDETTQFALEDLAVVCSNCHRMLHVDYKKVMSISGLRRALRKVERLAD